jgi:hypothetical protein
VLRPYFIIGDMNHRFSTGFIWLTLSSAILLTFKACAPASTPTFFVPPTEAPQLVSVTAAPTTAPVTSVPSLVIPTPTLSCTNNLTYVRDLTIPDGTNVTPGETVDKQWLVSNSGSCNWDSRYRLKLISGDSLGAPNEQALYPARAGTQATLRIVFTAPQDTGTYQSAWQAFAPDGSSFGSEVYIQISVGP